MGEVKNTDLEGRLVVISGDSQDSKELRDSLQKKFEEDHEIGSRIIPLDIKWMPYDNGEENFVFVDPENVLSMDNIVYLLKNSDSYFCTKLENPFHQDPLKYLLTPIVSKIGSRFSMLKSIGISNDEYKDRFNSFIANRISKDFSGLMDKELIENYLFATAEKVREIFENYDAVLMEVFKGNKDDVMAAARDSRLEMLKYTLSGYIDKKFRIRNKQIFMDELVAISRRIGTKIIQKGDKGRFNWAIPFIDGRSDHNRLNPYECIRSQELADIAALCNVDTVYTIRMHSDRQIRFFEENKIKPVTIRNMTLTNEFISLINQDMNTDFHNMYILSPDKGGVADAMVFARECYRITGGRFTGRVVVFDKERVKAADIKKMDFLASYIYKPDRERETDMSGDRSKRPYDLNYSSTFKKQEHEDYIGRLFELETNDLNLLKGIISGDLGVMRDDIIGTAATGIKASRTAADYFNSRIIMAVEHPSLIKNAISELDKLYQEGILYKVFTSKSIMHPNEGERPWHVTRGMSTRYKRVIKTRYMPWLEQNYSDIYKRLIDLRTPQN
jgi:phosphoribosylpyrophosphate synthetase